MINEPLTRRAVMAGAASVACWAAFDPVASAQGSEAGAAPYPTLTGGRVMPSAADDYASAMMSGGPGKDGIPSIDQPQFLDAAAADDYLDGGDIVFGLVENGVTRAYPQRILVWHEIVNDALGGLNLAVTYCPLTGTAIAFERGDIEFGVSGRLVNSNLVMYDRATDTWFPQVLAIGIQGPHTGRALVERPMVWTTWQRWREAHPDTEVLSTRTGFARNYNRDPYGAYNPRSGYYAPDSGTMFPLMNEDERFPPKSVVLGARTDSAAVAVPLDKLRAAGRLELDAPGEVFTALHDSALDTGYMFRGRTDAQAAVDGSGPGGVSWSGGDALEPVNGFEAMWFAWAAFYPETSVHG
ncbi:MAG: DUF3179 domain-containing protein [Hyphomicrobiales bacterium]